MNSSAEVTTHCPHHHHCDSDTAKVKAVTIIVEQRTRLKVIEVWWQTFMVPSYKNFCKYNFRNDHVITKIMKIWSYTAQNVEFKHWAHVCKYSHHCEVGNYSLGHILCCQYFSTLLLDIVS